MRRVNGTYSYADTTARAAFERGMHGDHGGSLGVTYRPSLAHEFTVAYMRAIIISATVRPVRCGLQLQPKLGDHLFRSQLIFQHHIGGVDGIRGDVPFLRNEDISRI